MVMIPGWDIDELIILKIPRMLVGAELENFTNASEYITFLSLTISITVFISFLYSSWSFDLTFIFSRLLKFM